MLGQEHDKHIWLGINDIVNEGEFVDNDGLPISFQNWNTDQPSNSFGNENAVILSKHSDEFKWNDVSADNTNPIALCVFNL